MRTREVTLHRDLKIVAPKRVTRINSGDAALKKPFFSAHVLHRPSYSQGHHSQPNDMARDAYTGKNHLKITQHLSGLRLQVSSSMQSIPYLVF